MTNALRAAAGVSVLAMIAGTALAQDRQTTDTKNQFQPESGSTDSPASASAAHKTKDLLAKGYEFKAFAIVPRAIVTGGGSTVDTDAVMIILQKGESLANCYVTFESFVNGTYYNGSVPACTVLQ
jgi:hypothetical protein